MGKVGCTVPREMTIEASTGQRNNYGKLMVAVGLLWLLLAAALLIYQLTNPGKVEITWETATEQQTAGFNLYRSSDPEEAFVLINENKLIDSKGGPVSGARYTYVDDEVLAGETYYYLLEEVEFDSTRNRHEEATLQYHVPAVTWWAVVLTAASAVIGLVILMAGLKENKTL